MAKRRKVSNLLGLQLLALLHGRPMHPYEMATMLREYGKEQDLKIQWGSLYTVVQNLEKHGFIEAAETVREGRRPERTVYRITDQGRAETADWLRDLIGTPEQEYPRLRTALSVVGVLSPDEAIGLLRQRVEALDAENDAARAELAKAGEHVPRLFLVESEYYLAIREAEAGWLRGLIVELTDATMDGIEQWRRYHETGVLDPEFGGPT